MSDNEKKLKTLKDIDTGKSADWCGHPDNLKYKLIKGNWKYPEHKKFVTHLNHPSKINKDNNCKWFKRIK